MIRFKPEVFIKTWTPFLECALLNISMWSNKAQIGVHISSIDDGTHGTTTLHGWSLAIDFNVDTMKQEDREAMYQYLRRHMPQYVDVICESDHVHMEWDIHRPEMRMQNQ
jgi:hypothetical protein